MDPGGTSSLNFRPGGKTTITRETIIRIPLCWKQTGRMCSIARAGEHLFLIEDFFFFFKNKLQPSDVSDFLRVFGLREDYAEILHLCRNCRCLFWKTYGHPCIVDHQPTDNKSDEPSCDPEAFYVPVPPQAFLKFFSL